MCCENNDNSSCILNILENILMLQQNDQQCSENNTCTRPFLGPSNNLACFNTRLINIYTCCNNTLWTMPINSTDTTSSVFRIESLDDETATFRILQANEDGTYSSTNDFFTIKTCCIGIIKCLGDTLITGI